VRFLHLPSVVGWCVFAASGALLRPAGVEEEEKEKGYGSLQK
jgi:hypothetical protein